MSTDQTGGAVARGDALCPDCGAAPGTLHEEGCDIERCPECGGQRLSCACEITAPRLPWTGLWPGVAECREFGWYAKLLPGRGWVPCGKGDRQAHEDLNRLHAQAIWSRERGRFVLPDGVVESRA